MSIDNKKSLSNAVNNVIDLLQDGKPEIYVSGLKGSASAFMLAHLRETLQNTFLVVTPSHDEAMAFYHEACFFIGKDSKKKSYSCCDMCDIALFPPLETRPYEPLSTHPEISGQRIWTLHRLCTRQQPLIVITCLEALLQKSLPHQALKESAYPVEVGSEIDRDHLCTRMLESGYARVSLVEDRGDFSVRGEVMDIFTPGLPKPVRIDFFGDTVESLRLFDQVTQRSFEDLTHITILPVKEVILNQQIIEKFKISAESDDYKKLFSEGKGKIFAENIQNRFFPSGIEYCLCFFHPQPETLFHYLPPSSIIFWKDLSEIKKNYMEFIEEAENNYLAALDEHRIASPPEDIIISKQEMESLKSSMQNIISEEWNIKRQEKPQVFFSTRSNEDIRGEMISFDSPKGALSLLVDKMRDWFDRGIDIFIVCHTSTQSERLRELFHNYGIQSRISNSNSFGNPSVHCMQKAVEIKIGELSRGFRSTTENIVIITEDEIFGERKRRPRIPKFKEGIAITGFSDINEGNFIVHRDHGIGIYKGLKTLQAGGITGDYLALEYLGGDKLYLPVDRINMLQRYEGAEDTIPRLDRLGGTSWIKVKKRVKESVNKMAKDLIELYSARKVYEGYAFSPPDRYYYEFEALFPYEETPDQLAAIEDVIKDMTSPRPMDRLVCGDVGYGKTEVALRAAFKAVMDGMQTAVLVPTTVLAQQHYQTFIERLSSYPVNIEILSRFKTAKEQKKILQGIASGCIDIVIGTHRLLQKDVSFKNLGLLIIDEEHRFGVRHKEQLKKLRKTVDVLTLTATPIPRTLQLSLLGIRDFSVIKTPPLDRLSIRTIVTHFDEHLIREAILKELRRGGQIFFVHDRVRSIHAMASFLKKLVPEIRLAVAHGQMKEKELEKSMMKFINKEVNLLLCTTIIESGLDFPTANTIIINRADKLGLAQMYQLRGRVGRGRLRAYAYLLVPGKTILNTKARNRLEALSEFTELGSGYRLAARDLQIRGAGNIFGHAQSGNIAAVGLDMYLELLDNAIHELKGEEVPPKIDPAVNLPIQAYLPEGYIPDINQRLVIYKRLASLMHEEEVTDLERELIDRYGSLPLQVKNLLEIGRLKSRLRRHLITCVDFNGKEIIFTFHEKAHESLGKILSLISHNRERFRFTPDHRLFAQYHGQSDSNLINEIKMILS